MRVPIMLCLGLTFLSVPAWSAEPSFHQEVLPVLTRAGCNSGACHGTPTGKNGFRLSLRGYDAQLDQHTLTREAGARRINIQSPAESLVLTKALGLVPHEGGKRFDAASPEYRILHDWIGHGATIDELRMPQRIELVPTLQDFPATVTTTSIRVMAYFDAQPRDVTHLAKLAVTDEERARVNTHGQIECIQRGEVYITAEYMGLFARAEFLFREDAPPPQESTVAVHNFIDEHTQAKWKRLGITPAPLTSDTDFLRRAHLDAIGRLPTPDEIRAFVEDSSPKKREHLIDRLLDRPEYADFWGMKWTDRLGVNQRFVGKIGAVKYGEWIRQQVAADVPEDEFARTILTASGGNYANPPAGFYRRLRDPTLRAEEIAQLFMGVRLQCAKCHNHPGDQWTQEDYYGLAAFFANIQYRNGPFFIQIYDKEETVFNSRAGSVTHPRTGKVIPPTFLLGGPLNSPSSGDPREAFAEWLTQPENPFFAQATANRIWYHLFGLGIVEPVDDFRISNPPSNEGLLDALAKELVRNGYSRKELIRTIMRSRTYQTSAVAENQNPTAEKYFARYPVRRLSAEQLLDAISDATGVPEKFPAFPLGVSAARLPDGEYKHPFLESFGRPARAMACECEREADTTLGQALQLVGGTTIDTKLTHPKGRVKQLAQSERTPDAIMDELFLVTLSRWPTDEERSVLRSRWDATADRQVAIQDIVHALLNHPEFVFHH